MLQFRTSFIVFSLLLFLIPLASCSGAEVKTPPKSEILEEGVPPSAAGQSVADFYKNLRAAYPQIDAFSGRFKIRAKWDKKRQTGFIDFWVDNRKNILKFVLKDTLFESKIQTIRVSTLWSELYTHSDQQVFRLPTTQLVLPDLLGEHLSFANFQPLLQNKLPAVVFNKEYAFVYPAKNRIYVNTPEYEAVYDFRKYRLARLIIREKKALQQVEIRIGYKKASPFPKTIILKSKESLATITFLRTIRKKAIPPKFLKFP